MNFFKKSVDKINLIFAENFLDKKIIDTIDNIVVSRTSEKYKLNSDEKEELVKVFSVFMKQYKVYEKFLNTVNTPTGQLLLTTGIIYFNKTQNIENTGIENSKKEENKKNIFGNIKNMFTKKNKENKKNENTERDNNHKKNETDDKNINNIISDFDSDERDNNGVN